MKPVQLHHSAAASRLVEESMLARQVGSGTVNVLATPMMIALMEQAASLCLSDYLEEGETSVGTYLATDHSRATPPGATVTATAEILSADGKCVTFRVEASDEKGIIGQGTHKRVVVNEQRFEQRAKESLNS